MKKNQKDNIFNKVIIKDAKKSYKHNSGSILYFDSFATTASQTCHTNSSAKQDIEPQDHSIVVAGEIALFRAVIMQALLDSVNNSKRTEDKIAKKQAIEWFNIDNSDFRTVCQLAQLNYKWVFNQSIVAISHNCKRINIRSKK